MTKAGLVEKISEINGFSRKDSLELLESVLEMMNYTLVSGEHLKIPCFGNFVVRQKAERRGRNPQTGDAMTLSSRKVITYKPSNVLKQRLNT